MQELDEKTKKKEKEHKHEENQSGGPYWSCASHGSDEEVETLQFPRIIAKVSEIVLLLWGSI